MLFIGGEDLKYLKGFRQRQKASVWVSEDNVFNSDLNLTCVGQHLASVVSAVAIVADSVRQHWLVRAFLYQVSIVSFSLCSPTVQKHAVWVNWENNCEIIQYYSTSTFSGIISGRYDRIVLSFYKIMSKLSIPSKCNYKIEIKTYN